MTIVTAASFDDRNERIRKGTEQIRRGSHRMLPVVSLVKKGPSWQDYYELRQQIEDIERRIQVLEKKVFAES